MLVSKFQIDFKNPVSKTGYIWDGDKIFPKQDGGYRHPEYRIHQLMNHKFPFFQNNYSLNHQLKNLEKT